MTRPTYTFEFFEQVLKTAEMYFAMEYHAGTREMVCRYVNRKLGYVPPKMVSAALRILRDRGTISWEKKVWWNTGV